MNCHLKDFTCIALPAPGAEQISGQCLTATVRAANFSAAAEEFARIRDTDGRTILVTDGTYTSAFRVGGVVPC